MDLSSILVGGTHWLNLVNTIYMSNGHKKDVLMSQETVQDWLVLSGLIDSTDFIEDIEILVKSVVDLRQICIRILSELDTQKTVSESVVNDLNTLAFSLRLYPSIVLEKNSIYHVFKGFTLCDEVLYQILASITDSFKTVSLDRIRKCEHEECILYFVDTSKGGKRRWCSMETCGNRKKASSFYARRKEK